MRVLFILLLLALPAAAQDTQAVTSAFAPDSTGTLLGHDVRDPAGDTLGLLADILVDKAGHPRAALIDLGGFLGVGTRRVAVAWGLLHFTVEDGETSVSEDIPPDVLAAAPEYRGGDDQVVVTGQQPAAKPAPTP
jgi:hypothetical protein